MTAELRCLMSWLALDQMARFERDSSVDYRLESIREAGYVGVQFDVVYTAEELTRCRALGLQAAASGRVNLPEEAEPLAARLSGDGFPCATLHVGWGLEDDSQAARLIESVLEASVRHTIPLHIETHRATIFQDVWRTVGFLDRFPQVTVNGDFSHWYTGLEFVYGGFETKLAFIEPVLRRVRFLHGRIGNPGSMQVAIEGEPPYVRHFRQMWTRAMAHYPPDTGPLYFVPELLAPRIYYGRLLPDGREECDRWQQSLLLCELARRCFAEAGRIVAG
ncbi:hypothetical protein [Paludibaculum fermentans]|uniref:hypothetical protein n=1 Tax=Paludibaculum fermentans TaxID=1473598 RepID=UPI003EBB56EE